MFHFGKKDNEPEIVPEKLHERIDYKIFIVIIAGLLAYQFYLYSFKSPDDPNIELVETTVTTVTALIASVIGFFVAKRYWNSKVFGTSYLALALGMLMNAVGERVYYFLEHIGQTPSPSVADIFWLAFYPLAFYHLARNISFFKAKIRLPVKALVILLPIVITGVYAFLEYGQEQAADTTFFLGLAYTIGGSVILSGAILGAIIFRQGILGVPWLVLTMGIILTTAGDVWYSYVDLYNGYTITHVLNLLWYAGYLVIAYALYKHKKVI
jgi:hypothetical protein